MKVNLSDVSGVPQYLLLLRTTALISLIFVSFFAYPQEIAYPYPVVPFRTEIENKPVTMVYMDVSDATPNGHTIVLLHGKNFNGYYWKNVIPVLAGAGYRVIVPDQLGWGRSSKPEVHYSFHMLANNTKQLLDSLGIRKCFLIGHSMGGMLATRFSLMFPASVKKLILENPIGLEDYKTFVPYKTVDALFEVERKATYASYRKYQQGYYPEWKPEYEQYVQAQAADLNKPGFDTVAFVNALTYQMIYEQPVVYEFQRLKVPVLLILGQGDRTVVGKNQLSESQKKLYGNYPALGKKLKRTIAGLKLIELPGVGHIPHIQTPDLFCRHVLSFLKTP